MNAILSIKSGKTVGTDRVGGDRNRTTTHYSKESILPLHTKEVERLATLEQEYLTANEVSNLLKLHPSTLYKWAKRNKLPFFRLGYKSIRFRKIDIELFIAEGREQKLRYRKDKRYW
jgi:excisionase family DNA binding protein